MASAPSAKVHPAATPLALRVGPFHALAQALLSAVGAAAVPLVRLLSFIFGGRPRPCVPVPATRCVPPGGGSPTTLVLTRTRQLWHSLTLPHGVGRLRKVGDTGYVTSPEALDQAVKQLSAGAAGWAATSFAQRARLARQCAQNSLLVAEAMTADAIAYKGTYDSVGDGEEYTAWSFTPAVLNDTARTLDALHAGRPRAPAGIRKVGNRTMVRVFPCSGLDHLLFSGYAGELWLTPGSEATAGSEAVRGGPGEVCVILGAGNQAVVPVGDVALKALVHGCACVLAMNPVNEWAGPHLERTFEPLIKAGALRIVYGGVQTGKALTGHPAVQCVHITGSDKTYDAIVWQGQPKAPGMAPPFSKPVSAELGCVTPFVMVPGPWSDADLDTKAAEVVAAVAHNNSCNCLAAKVLILGRNWDRKDAFLAALRAQLGQAQQRHCFYPGSSQKYDAFVTAFPQAEALGQPAGQAQAGRSSAEPTTTPLPFLLLPPQALSPGDKALVDEAWSPVLAVRELDTPAGDVSAFLHAAKNAVNTSCWGTLSCSVYIHPSTEAAKSAAFQQYLTDVRYGAIGVNTPTLMCFFMPSMSWGGFPGHTQDDIQSGVGIVHNTFCVDNVEKSVLRGPWYPPVTPFWSVRHGNMHAMARSIVAYMANPSVWTLTRLVVAAVQG